MAVVEPAAEGRMAERTLFEEGGVRITTARVVVGTASYALSSITSVRQRTERPSTFWAALLALAGMVLVVLAGVLLLPFVLVAIGMAAVVGNGGPIDPTAGAATGELVSFLSTVGSMALPGICTGTVAAMCFIGTVALLRAAPVHVVVFGTTAGDRPAVRTDDESLAARVREAVERVLVER